MTSRCCLGFLILSFAWTLRTIADESPYITTRSELTLLSGNDGEADPSWRTTEEGLTDFCIRTKDSFTVIRLGPGHPPICQTISGTVPCSMLGTPRMAMSADGRFGLITNHGIRIDGSHPAKYADGGPLTNDDLKGIDLLKQDLAPQRSNMLSMIDLGSPDFPVVQRILFEDCPLLVLAHPDREHFVVGGSKYFYVYRLDGGTLIEVTQILHDKGFPEFDINPAGDRILTTQGDWTNTAQLPVVRWYSFTPTEVTHLAEVHIQPGVNTRLTPDAYILRISRDGKKALICQDSMGAKGTLSDVLVADLTKSPPVINSVIKQVNDGVESFAFHPNGKMAVATCLSKTGNNIAVFDIDANPPTVLYYLDAGGGGQGIEFSPEGDKLFVGSSVANRIEVFDVVGDYELRKCPKFLKTGYGHCNLTIGPTFRRLNP